VSRLQLPRGLYVITDMGHATLDALLAAVASALDGGARTVQYRDKGADGERREREAAALVGLCRARSVPLIVNDDVALAASTRADGVHLGEHDATPTQARALLGPDAIVGVSCYDSLERAERARAQGADYVAFGSFFPSPTKPHARRPPVDLLARACARIGLPVVAIGGITPANGAALVEAGAHALAVVSGVFAQPDVQAAARRYAALFDRGVDPA
jgi:thiamine-phosphate pyrophosphorylase